MCINIREREELYRKQQKAVRQIQFCNLSFFAIDERTHNPRILLQRPSIANLLRRATKKEMLGYHSTIIEGHTYGPNKSYKILLASHVHAAITREVNSIIHGSMNEEMINEIDLRVTREKAREHLMSHWEWASAKVLPNYAMYSTLSAAWIHLLDDAHLLETNEEAIELLAHDNPIPDADYQTLCANIESNLFQRMFQIPFNVSSTLQAEPVIVAPNGQLSLF